MLKYITDVVPFYLEKGRHYHGVRHIHDCMKEVEPFWKCCQDQEVVRAAIWFHDVVYDPKANDNEEASCHKAVEILKRHEYADSFIESVVQCIMATKHTGPASTPDGMIVADADLACFAASRPVFDQNTKAVRLEYSFVKEREFKVGRAKVFQAFLDRPRIYQTQMFFDKYEKQARERLKVAIRELLYGC